MSKDLPTSRFSRLHPYPGMIADQLAVELSNEYVSPGDRVLDPFCGSGRTLVTAADRGATAIGVDVNPLAVLLSLAKGAVVRRSALENLRETIRTRSAPAGSEDLDMESGRQVKWFSAKAKRELSSLIGLLNETSLSQSELRLAACILSATARDVSFCRKDQWKIHRMPAGERSCFRRSAWQVFLSRLDYVLKEVRRSPRLSGTVRAFIGDATKLEVVNACNNTAGFDLVFTSPPYGDSRTTVQYGGISSLCLGVLKFLSGLVIPAMPTRSIDACCLGGALDGQQSTMTAAGFTVSSFWSGETDTTAARRVTAFLGDLLVACEGFTRRLKHNGHAIFVVGRRTVAGPNSDLTSS